jgi:uncharacterized protein (DUF2267 family)
MELGRNQTDLETANRVRRTVAATARLPAELTAEAAIAAVMCALTERLTAGEAFAVLENVPLAIAPMFELCVYHRQRQPTSKLGRAELVARVAEHLGVTPAHAELIASAVFTAVRAELPPEVVMTVAVQLPHGLKELWLGAPVMAPDLDVEIAPKDARDAIERDLERRSALPNHVTPAAAFSAVMCSFARRLSGGETRHVLLGLPAVVRPLLERCAAHHTEYADVFGRRELLHEIEDHLFVGHEVAEHIALEVLRAVKRNLPQHTIDEVASQLPPDLRELWDEALPVHSLHHPIA